MKKFSSIDSQTMRSQLLALRGIGKETADSIMLYAAGKLSFVIDAYTKRVVSRLFGVGELDYDSLQQVFEKSFGSNLILYKDMHAQIVTLGKNYCKKKNPLCDNCPLKNICAYAFA